jgi:hypothetical protein
MLFRHFPLLDVVIVSSAVGTRLRHRFRLAYGTE